jgi:hypothetical protein
MPLAGLKALLPASTLLLSQLAMAAGPPAPPGDWPALGNDPGSYRAEFLTLVEKAKALGGNATE